MCSSDLSNSSYGYFAGGLAGSNLCTIDRLDFSTETVTTPTPQLSQARNGLAGTQSSSYGYFAGGSGVCTIDRLDFSTDTVTIPIITPKLSQARVVLAAVASNSYGYFGGGDAPGYVCTIDRIDFTTETVTVPAPKLSQARSRLAGVTYKSKQIFKTTTTSSNNH